MSSLQYMFVIFGIIAISLKHARAFTADEAAAIKAGLRPFMLECSKEYNINEDDIKKAKESNNFESIDSCVFACLGKKIGVLNDKGEFVPEKAAELTKKFVLNKEEQKKGLEIIEKCTSVNDESVSDDKGCERAVLLHKCFEPYRDQFSFAR